MMLSQAPVAAMLPAVDLERAKKFYRDMLGLTEDAGMTDAPGVVMFKAGGGTMLGLYEREATKADHTAACFEVGNIEGTIAELKGKGVQFEEYNMPDFKTVNSVVTMGMHKAAWFKDTEGNILGLAQKG